MRVELEMRMGCITRGGSDALFDELIKRIHLHNSQSVVVVLHLQHESGKFKFLICGDFFSSFFGNRKFISESKKTTKLRVFEDLRCYK